jgi:nitrate reductase molybdenum cofactor assembly chaperone NarJ/NarW
MNGTQLSRTLRALSRVLDYPNRDTYENLPELSGILVLESLLSPSRRHELERLIAGLTNTPLLDVEANYVATFDRGRNTCLHLFEHVHGDSRERGPALIDLAQTYANAGLFLTEGELPDYLPTLLEFASTQPRREAIATLAEVTHILNTILNTLLQRKSAYASIFAALIEIAGETVREVAVEPERPMDESWAEPAAFAGCSSQGQSRPDSPQPIVFVAKPNTPTRSKHGALA